VLNPIKVPSPNPLPEGEGFSALQISRSLI
jgi:hypothetical protein